MAIKEITLTLAGGQEVEIKPPLQLGYDVGQGPSPRSVNLTKALVLRAVSEGVGWLFTFDGPLTEPGEDKQIIPTSRITMVSGIKE